MENKQKFAPGDVVQLNSGGPVMTVLYGFDDGSVRCEWFPFSRESGYALDTMTKAFQANMLMSVRTDNGRYIVAEAFTHRLPANG